MIVARHHRVTGRGFAVASHHPNISCTVLFTIADWAMDFPDCGASPSDFLDPFEIRIDIWREWHFMPTSFPLYLWSYTRGSMWYFRTSPCCVPKSSIAPAGSEGKPTSRVQFICRYWPTSKYIPYFWTSPCCVPKLSRRHRPVHVPIHGMQFCTSVRIRAFPHSS